MLKDEEVLVTSGVGIYTVMFDGYDILFPAAKQTLPSSFYAFVDHAGAAPAPWRPVVSKRKQLAGASVTRANTNRHIKIVTPDLITADCDYSIYVDANVRVIGDLAPLVRDFVQSGAPIAVFRHPTRTSIAEEAEVCITRNRVKAHQAQGLRDQVQGYFDAGFPQSHQLTENSVIFRWHKHPIEETLAAAWWEAFSSGAPRDQISLPYVLWRLNLEPLYWNWTLREPNPYFARHPHSGTRLRDLRTRFFVHSEGTALGRMIVRGWRGMRGLTPAGRR